MTKRKLIANYEIECCACGTLPTVDIKKKGKKTYHSELCGACYFGEAVCHDPDEWESK